MVEVEVAEEIIETSEMGTTTEETETEEIVPNTAAPSLKGSCKKKNFYSG